MKVGLAVALSVRTSLFRTPVTLAFGAAVLLMLAGCKGVSKQEESQVWEPKGLSDKIVEQLVIDPRHPSVLYAYAYNDFGNVRVAAKSTDGGSTWRNLDEVVAGLKISPARSRIIYGQLIGPNGGFTKSRDGGESWSKTTGAEVLAIDPNAPQTLYGIHGATPSITLIKSTNGGDSWSRLTRDLGGVSVSTMAADSRNPSALYLGLWGVEGGGAGILKSTDGGRSWRRTGFWNVPALGIEVAVNPVKPHTLYAALDEGIHQSVDGGASWAKLTVGHLGRRPKNPRITFDPSRADTFYVTAQNVYGDRQFIVKTTNGGLSWARVKRPGSVSSLVVDPTGQRLYAGTDKGVFLCRVCWRIESPGRKARK